MEGLSQMTERVCLQASKVRWSLTRQSYDSYRSSTHSTHIYWFYWLTVVAGILLCRNGVHHARLGAARSSCACPVFTTPCIYATQLRMQLVTYLFCHCSWLGESRLGPLNIALPRFRWRQQVLGMSVVYETLQHDEQYQATMQPKLWLAIICTVLMMTQ